MRARGIGEHFTGSRYGRLSGRETILQEKYLTRSDDPVVYALAIGMYGRDYSRDLDRVSFRWREHLLCRVVPTGIRKKHGHGEAGPAIKPVVWVWTAGKAVLALVTREHYEAQVNGW